jgi:cyclophilin family peptidyl-prolyl cis-trans isomerase
MAFREARRYGMTGWIGAALVFGMAMTAGCDRFQSGLGSEDASAASKTTPAEPEACVPVDPRMQQSFAEATRKDPPADGQRPPDVTLTGKSVGKLYSEVVNSWDTYQLVNSKGNLLNCTATLETEMGTIEITLRPDLAPNHVRNLIALTQLGYYDGLVFERTVHARSQEQPENEVELIEAGCPLGTGDLGCGSLGYWLKPEFTNEPHEAGTVGACHGAEPDTAACRFYITLNKAPILDGNFTVFGKVTKGLDIARKIYSLPVRNDTEYPEGDRPQKPVVIRKVTIDINYNAVKK